MARRNSQLARLRYLDVRFSQDGKALLKSGNFKSEILREPLLGDTGDAGEEHKPVCRICRDDEDVELLIPCRCAGSSAATCRDCLTGWRNSNKAAQACCELCGFAFMFEYETATWRQWSKETMRISRRTLLVVVALVAALVGLPGGLMRIYYEVRGKKVPDEQDLNVTVFSAIALLCIGDILYEIYASFPAQRGTLKYELTRIRKPANAIELEVWELQKDEWEKHGITPDERQDHKCSMLAPCMFGIAGYLCLMLFVVAQSTEAVPISDWLESSEVTTPVVAIYCAYVFLKLIVFIVSAVVAPPLQVRLDDTGLPCVRSLSKEERKVVMLACADRDAEVAERAAAAKKAEEEEAAAIKKAQEEDNDNKDQDDNDNINDTAYGA